MTYRITEADIDAFTMGDCWVLAREISRLTGWKIVAFGAYPEYTEHYAQRTLEDFDWVHVVVQTPEGDYLDVDGISTERELIDRYEDHVWGKYDWEPDYFDFEEVATRSDWKSLRIRYRVYPEVSAEQVAEALINGYLAASLLAA